MQTIELTAGTTIHHAARMLRANAPARAIFNDIPIRARYATTRPEDIVKQYHWDDEIRRIQWQHSPKGIAAAKRTAEALASAQAAVNDCVQRLPALDMADARAALAWVEEMAPAADHYQISYDHSAIVATFDAAGWRAGMNCGDAFDVESADNFAHWIVGQWLASRMPLVVKFIGDWREKFPAETVPGWWPEGVEAPPSPSPAP